MKSFRLLMLCMTVSLLGLSSMARADDIDVYSDNAGSTGVPNVLLVLDNSANFSAAADTCEYADTPPTVPSLNGTAGGIEQCAIYNVIKNLPARSVNIGLMTYNENNITDINNQNCRGPNGGCLVYPLTLMDDISKPIFLQWIKSWKKAENDPGFNIKAQNKSIAASMQEAWAYYAGAIGLSGRSYANVKPTAGCQKNFVIYIGNAVSSSSTPGDGGNADPVTALAEAPNVTADQKAIIPIPSGSYGTSSFSCGNYTMGNSHNTKNDGLYADEWARYASSGCL